MNVRPIQLSNRNVNFGNLTKISYAVVDDCNVSATEVLKDLTAHFIRQLNKGEIKDNELRIKLNKAVKDYSSEQGYVSLIKRIGNYIITGKDALNLSNIWNQSGVAQALKKEQASEFISQLFSKGFDKIALIGKSDKLKGKVRYEFTDLYSTIY